MQPIGEVIKFLEWKHKIHEDHFTEEDVQIIKQRDKTKYCNLSARCCSYSKGDMVKFTEFLWSTAIRNEFQCDGHSTLPNPSYKALPIPRNITREMEVLLMSQFYDNNLLRGFLHRAHKHMFNNPLCHCEQDIQTVPHILFQCPVVPTEIRNAALTHMRSVTGSVDSRELNTTMLLNISRDRHFIKLIIEILSIQRPHLNLKVELN